MPNIWYVDGQNGSASNGGTSPSDALTLISAAVTAASDGDTIHVIHTHTAAVTYTENINLLHVGLKLIGPGRRLAFISGSTGSATVQMTKPGTWIEGFRVDNSGTASTDHAFRLAHTWCTIKDCQSFDAGGSLAYFDGSDDSVVIGTKLDAGGGSADYCVEFAGATTCLRNQIINCTIEDSASDGILIGSGDDDTLIAQCVIRGNGGYGINDGGGDRTMVVDCTFGNNTSGPINAGGTNLAVTGGIRTSKGYPLDVVSLQHGRGR